MAHKKLRLMISSRCRTPFPIGERNGVELSEIRKELKREIEKENCFGKPLLNVWINEEESAEGTQTSWDECIKQAEESDLFISMLDGSAGWQVDSSGIGICHAEFEGAYSHSPGKVRVISLITNDQKQKVKNGPDKDFLKVIEKENLWQTSAFSNIDQLKQHVKAIVREQVLQLAHEGAREVKKSGPNTGQALDWSRLNFTKRKDEMIKVLKDSLIRKGKSKPFSQQSAVSVHVSNAQVLFIPNAIPAAFSVSAAREMVGQPFLKDHEHVVNLEKGIQGPVHVIACHKNVTEAQAMSILGFPDATIVSGSFGVYVADNIQKIQMCLISHCIDAASTKHGLQRLFEWLERTQEDRLLAVRAKSRAKILRTIAGEMA